MSSSTLLLNSIYWENPRYCLPFEKQSSQNFVMKFPMRQKNISSITMKANFLSLYFCCVCIELAGLIKLLCCSITCNVIYLWALFVTEIDTGKASMELLISLLQVVINFYVLRANIYFGWAHCFAYLRWTYKQDVQNRLCKHVLQIAAVASLYVNSVTNMYAFLFGQVIGNPDDVGFLSLNVKTSDFKGLKSNANIFMV